VKPIHRLLLTTFFLATASLYGAEAEAYRFVAQCGPTWSTSPVTYYINQNGTKHISSLETIERVFQDSFDEWSKPCCSNFGGQYAGRTQLTATNNQGRIVMSFEDNAWPAEFGGRSTIAVTLLSWSQRCRMIEAPILFNSVHHTFRTNGQSTDLQSIATHEIGHLLGLDHSHLQQATMYAAYVGGSSARTIHEDDIQGVCALYPRPCSCTSSTECPGREQCVNGVCQKVPCSSNLQCDAGEECVNGDCVVPPCRSNADCAEHFQCQSGACVSTCPVCRDCQSNADCGFNGFCADFGGGGKCIVACSSGGLCPGDSVCYQLDQGSETYYICLNPNAGREPCPDGYVCKEGSGAPVQGCPGLGTTCNADGSSCNVANDVCIQEANGNVFCSCTCSTDADCGSGNQCVSVGSGRACIPGSSSDPCAGVTCPSGQRCSNGQCVADGTGTTPGTGGESPGSGDPYDDDIIILLDDEDDGGSCMGCATAPAPSSPVLPVLFGLAMAAAYRTRRRN
jgi:MYXO-CTERM domain-containing protein